MRRDFDEGKPIFQQVRERIEDQIVNDQLKEEIKHLQTISWSSVMRLTM